MRPLFLSVWVLLVALFACLPLTAQINELAGTIVLADGQPFATKIRVAAGQLAPTSVTYQTSAGKWATAGVSEFRSFTTDDNTSKLERFTVLLDRNPLDVDRLKQDKTPKLKEQTVILRYLIEGDVDLLYWADEGRFAYFIREGADIPEQLLFHRYLIEQTRVKEDRNYVYQLSKFACPTASKQPSPASLDYREKDFLAFVTAANACRNASNEVFGKKYSPLQIKFGGGVRVSALQISSPSSRPAEPLATKVHAVGAAEVTYFFNPISRRSAVFLLAQYSSFDTEGVVFDRLRGSEYSAINFTIGGRYSNRLLGLPVFADIGVDLNLPFNSRITLLTNPGRQAPQIGELNVGLRIAAGIEFIPRVSATLAYQVPHNTHPNSATLVTYLQTFTASVLYQLFPGKKGR